MDGRRFDAIIRILAAPTPRRRVVRALAVVGLGGALLPAAPRRAAARARS